MIGHIKTVKPELPDTEFCWDHEIQEALSEAMDAAMDNDKLASHWVNVKVGDNRTVANITHISVRRDEHGYCEITIQVE